MIQFVTSNEKTSTPTGPIRLSNEIPVLSPIENQQMNKTAITLINKEIITLREILVTIQDQVGQINGKITVTNEKINTLMERSHNMSQGVNEISEVTYQEDRSCTITMSQTAGDETVMTPGQLSYSEATPNVKPTPAPRKTNSN